MVDLLTHPLHLVLAILLLICAVVVYMVGLVYTLPWILAVIVFELGFWFSVFSSSKMVGRHEDHPH